jgi:hypothetical protein
LAISGIEDAVTVGVSETKETALKENMPLRTAAYFNAIQRMDKFYE